MPQKSVLFKGTIRDNILLGREQATDDEVTKAIAAAQAAAAETLESPLGWRYAVTEDTLTAVAALNGETLLFELTLAPAADGAVDSGILTRALDWLKTVTIG